MYVGRCGDAKTAESMRQDPGAYVSATWTSNLRNNTLFYCTFCIIIARGSVEEQLIIISLLHPPQPPPVEVDAIK